MERGSILFLMKLILLMSWYWSFTQLLHCPFYPPYLLYPLYPLYQPANVIIFYSKWTYITFMLKCLFPPPSNYCYSYLQNNEIFKFWKRLKSWNIEYSHCLISDKFVRFYCFTISINFLILTMFVFLGWCYVNIQHPLF